MTSQQNPLEHLTREELIRRVEDLNEELRMSRAFSNISETGANDATLQWRGRNRFLAEKVLPVRLEPAREQSLNPDHQDGHRIIDGDNLSVMQSLLAEFRGGPKHGIDVIYMDPPYNTGEDVFSYNDDYRFSPSEVKKLRRKHGRSEALVSLDDPSRHTKWINHMAPRLWVARKLLKDTGVIIVSIDEHELPRLWMLMEEMFGEKNRIATLVWERSRKNDAKYISEGHEYMLVWARNKDALDALTARKGKWREPKPGLELFLEEFDRLTTLHPRDYKAISNGLKAFVKGIKNTSPFWTIRQYIHIDSKYEELGPFKEEDPSWPGGGGPNYSVWHPQLEAQVRTPPKGWIIPSVEDFMELDKQDRIVWKGLGTPKVKKYLLEGREKDVITSVIRQEARRSVMLSKSLFGFDYAFKNPKDHLLLKRLFRVVTWDNPQAVFLDPYAGSGTTGHAVIEMNAEDEGHRRFILIENGDPTVKAKIARDQYTTSITAERIRRVVSGDWADDKAHRRYDTGFTFFRAREEINKKAIMASTREALADVILQVVEEDSNRVDCRVDGYTYLIGRTRLNYGIALVWQTDKEKNDQLLTWSILEQALDEAEKAGVQKPIHIYATGNVAAVSDDLYRFHQIPDSILVRLNIINGFADGNGNGNGNGNGYKEHDA